MSGMFGYADEPWLPTLWDVEKLKADDNPYWNQFGWENLVVPEGCPTVASRMDTLKVRFDERYANRRLNRETMEQWQLNLQSRFDEMAPRYERAYMIYANKEQQMLDDVEEGSITTTNATSTGKNIDTPDSIVNAGDDYADALTKNTAEGTTQVVITGTGLVRAINATIDEWRELDTEFIREFEGNFLNILWY